MYFVLDDTYSGVEVELFILGGSISANRNYNYVNLLSNDKYERKAGNCI